MVKNIPSCFEIDAYVDQKRFGQVESISYDHNERVTPSIWYMGADNMVYNLWLNHQKYPYRGYITFNEIYWPEIIQSIDQVIFSAYDAGDKAQMYINDIKLLGSKIHPSTNPKSLLHMPILFVAKSVDSWEFVKCLKN